MGFLNYLLLGTVAFFLGWLIRNYGLNKLNPKKTQYKLTDPLIIGCLAGFFILMLLVSWLIGHFALKHQQMDIVFILVNSVVATFVFYFGLNPEQNNYNVPD